MKNFLKTLVCISLCCLLGCSSCIDDYREEAWKQEKKLKCILSDIRTKEDIKQKEIKFRKIFSKLVDLIIHIRELEQKGMQSTHVEIHHTLSDQLQKEFERVYQIQGAKELIEECQSDALHKLDAYNKKLIKKRKI